MRVCVAGGTGTMSTAIVHALLEFGHQIAVFTRGRSESRLPGGARFMAGERRDRHAFEATMQAERFDAAIDMISFTAGDTGSAICGL